MMFDAELPQAKDSPRRIVLELTNICNLHCSYCLRDDEARDPSRFAAATGLARGPPA